MFGITFPTSSRTCKWYKLIRWNRFKAVHSWEKFQRGIEGRFYYDSQACFEENRVYCKDKCSCVKTYMRKFTKRLRKFCNVSALFLTDSFYAWLLEWYVLCDVYRDGRWNYSFYRKTHLWFSMGSSCFEPETHVFNRKLRAN